LRIVEERCGLDRDHLDIRRGDVAAAAANATIQPLDGHATGPN
jgi:hypothetical protein